jgi:hypothetical protein
MVVPLPLFPFEFGLRLQVWHRWCTGIMVPPLLFPFQSWLRVQVWCVRTVVQLLPTC